MAEHAVVTVAATDFGVLLCVVGELDMASWYQVTDTIAEVASQGMPGLEIDLEHVTFIDSLGLRSILAAHETAVNAGVPFRITKTSPAVERVINLAGLTQLFDA